MTIGEKQDKVFLTPFRTKEQVELSSRSSNFHKIVYNSKRE